jgi:hypothetical protein
MEHPSTPFIVLGGPRFLVWHFFEGGGKGILNEIYLDLLTGIT